MQFSKLLLSALAGLSLIISANAKSLAWERSGDSIALKQDGETLWQLNVSLGDCKPYFHPLATKDGFVLTQENPVDHVWHHGLWFCFKFLNGVNFWEEDPGTGLSKGRTQVIEIKTVTKDDYSAEIELVIDYSLPRQAYRSVAENLIREQRTIQVSPPDSAGNYLIDFHHHFRALTDVTLGRTPLPHEPDGKSYGGYAGLSFRHQGEPGDWQLKENWQFIAPNSADELHGSSQPWMAYAGKLGEGSAGTAIFDHPSNFNYPSKWYAARPIVYYSPAFIFDSNRTLKKGETLDLRYRVKIYSEAPEKEALEKEWQRFANKDFTTQ